MIVSIEYNSKDKLTRYYYDIKEIYYNFSAITLKSKYDTVVINPYKVEKMIIKESLEGDDNNDC